MRCTHFCLYRMSHYRGNRITLSLEVVMQIEAKKLKQGDVFIFKDRLEVAVEDFTGGDCLCVTTEEYYLTSNMRDKFAYGYTNATIIPIKADDKVKLVKNIES